MKAQELQATVDLHHTPEPLVLDDIETAPLLCAGAIGYRSLQLTGLRNGEPLGLTGFGGSGHLSGGPRC